MEIDLKIAKRKVEELELAVRVRKELVMEKEMELEMWKSVLAKLELSEL